MRSGTTIGNDKFKVKVELAVGHKVGLAKVGRPKKSQVMKLGAELWVCKYSEALSGNVKRN